MRKVSWLPLINVKLLPIRFSLFLIIVLCRLLCFGQGNSLLWKISGNGLTAPSYLYGTMHSRDSRIFHFADSVLIKLEECHAFAMEVVADNALQGKVMKAILMDSAFSLKQLLSVSQFDSVDNYCQKNFGYSISILNRVKPIYTALLLSQTDLEEYDSLHAKESFFLDQYLQNLATLQQKKVYGLESAEEQLQVFDVLSYEEQASILMKTIREMPSENSEYEAMIKYYIDNNLLKMMAFENDFSLPDTLFYALFTERNNRMASRIDSLIRNQGTFIAVGAGHLGGEKGLVSLLREKGYNVIPVIPSYNNYLEGGWYHFTSMQNQFTVDFPSPPELTIESNDSLDSYRYTGSIASFNGTNWFTLYVVKSKNFKSYPTIESFLHHPVYFISDASVVPGHFEKTIWNNFPAGWMTYALKGGKMITVLAIEMKGKLVLLKIEDSRKITKTSRERFFNSFKIFS